MLQHGMIKLLHVVFVFSLGTVTLWLFFRSLISDKVRRSSPSKRAELFLRVFRDGRQYLKIDLEKSHYLIGRGPECDILLKGMGMPVRVGELFHQNGEYFFKSLSESTVMNDNLAGTDPRKLLPGDKIMLYNYAIQIDGRQELK